MAIALADIPVELPAFFAWFRTQTEATWATYDFSTHEAEGKTDWQRGTHWLGGLSEQQLAMVEERWGIRFPPDYRLFLATLHTLDRPALGKKYRTDAYGVETFSVGEELAFANWLTDDEYINHYLNQWIREGLAFDIEYNNLWRDSWGPKPASITAQQARVAEILAHAPKMIPIYHHRFLLAEPCTAGNPIYSIWQADIIIYGDTLRDYLLFEFADLLPIDRKEIEDYWWQQRVVHEPFYMQVPFWHELATL